MLATTIERKSLDFKIKSFKDAGNGAASVYFASFNSVDRANERILPGAFRNLPDFLRDGFIALGHDWSSLPIGLPTSAVQDRKGLLVGFDFHGTPQAQAARTVMKERMERSKGVKGSIGYTVIEDDYRDGVRELKTIDLMECSIVNVPCNPAADVVGIKGLSGRRAARQLTDAEVTSHKRWLAEIDAEIQQSTAAIEHLRMTRAAGTAGGVMAAALLYRAEKAGVISATQADAAWEALALPMGRLGSAEAAELVEIVLAPWYRKHHRRRRR